MQKCHGLRQFPAGHDQLPVRLTCCNSRELRVKHALHLPHFVEPFLDAPRGRTRPSQAASDQPSRIALRCASVSRGIVLWPDSSTDRLIRALWEEIARQGLPSMATHTHRLHQPHVSLVVAEHIPVRASLQTIRPVPREPIKLLIEAAGIFPIEESSASNEEDKHGRLFLACVASSALLDEQRRVHAAVRPLALGSWPHFEPGTWTPHLTTAWTLSPQQLASALAIVMDKLPIEGWLDHGGVEDGSGERWRSAAGVACDL